MSLRVKLEGAAELDRALRELRTATARRVAKRAMTKALEPVKAAAIAAAPVSSDDRHMADGITIASKLTRNQARKAEREGKHLTLMFVGPRSPHAHLVEFGTAQRFRKREKWAGKSTGAMPPQPFMRPAWDENRDQVLEILMAELRVELDKAVARAARRAAKGTDRRGG